MSKCSLIFFSCYFKSVSTLLMKVMQLIDVSVGLKATLYCAHGEIHILGAYINSPSGKENTSEWPILTAIKYSRS